MTGEAPLGTIRWDPVPGRTAVVVIDPQNDFLHPECWCARSGIDIAHMRRTIEPTHALVAAARDRNLPVIWTRHGFDGVHDAGVFLGDGGLRRGGWGYEIIEDVGARPDDLYVEKRRLNAFCSTDLEIVLRSLGADTVLFAGVLTSQCVAATRKDASFRDFKPIVVEERACTGTILPHLHKPAIEMIRVERGAVRDLATTLDEIAALPLLNRASGAGEVET